MGRFRFVLIGLIFLFPSTVGAQDSVTTCQAVVAEALASLGSGCVGLDPGTTCYGHPELVHTAFTGPTPANFYTQPGDRAELARTEALQTGPLQLQQRFWGLNVMRVAADPEPSTGAVYLQLGGVEVENGVDALNGTEAPMQRFYIRSGIGGIPCADAPSFLLVQGPERASADIWVHDQHVRIQSTILLRLSQDGTQLELLVLSGLALLFPDTPAPLLIPPGYVSTIRLGDTLVSLGIEGDADERATVGDWTAPRPLTAEELEALRVIEALPAGILHYDIDVPDLITASGVGGSMPVLAFEDAAALEQAQIACAAGLLSEGICEYLGIS